MKNDFRTKLLKEYSDKPELLNVMFAGIPAKEIYKGMWFYSGNTEIRIKHPYEVMDVGVIIRPDPSVNWVPAPNIYLVVVETTVGWFYAENVVEWMPNLGEGMKVATPKGQEGVIINIQPNRACHVEVSEGVFESYTEADLKRLTVYDELLKQFVGTAQIFPPHLRSPHKQGDFVYATDRHIMICIPADDAHHPMSLNYESDFINSPAGFNFQFCFEQAMSESRIVPEIAIDIQASKEAFKLVPLKDVYNDCETCKGKGEIHCCACGHNARCYDCNGSGKGDEIVGKEYDAAEHVIDINGAWFSPRHAQLLLTVAEIAGELIHVVINDSTGNVNVFRCGNIKIAVTATSIRDITNVSRHCFKSA